MKNDEWLPRGGATMTYYGEKRALGKWWSFGYAFNAITLGITINRHQIGIDLIFFWISVEL